MSDPLVRLCQSPEKRHEVDFASMFFALLNARSFHATVEFAAKSARRQMSTHATSAPQASAGADVHDAGISTRTTSQQHPSGPKRAADVDDADATNTASPNKRLRPLQIGSSSSTLIEDMQRLLETQPSQIRFDESGSLTTTCAQEQTLDFRLVGVAVEKILSSRLSKSTTVLHMDGLRSVEKESAHDKRDQKLSMQLETLERDYADGKLHNKRQLYKRLKASYRAPPEALSAVLEVLT
ncbi:MAG: hypothetical protein J3R72DRAFT_419837 [Linnemannia gamsii]|nr:MAG: hypothetical protein J3R72DRAFT_419837 [Linnemannia gamsii]